jgi:hypothetical protein
MKFRAMAHVFVAIYLLFMATAQAQAHEDRLELRGTLGWSTFPVDGFLHHFTVGGAARWYFSRRFGIEPELMFMYRDRTDKDLVFVPNLIWDFTRRDGKVQPYLIGGVGLLHHRGSYGPYRFSGTNPSFGAGLGVKCFVSRRVYLTPEVRIGWEPFMRIGMSIGFNPGR